MVMVGYVYIDQWIIYKYYQRDTSHEYIDWMINGFLHDPKNFKYFYPYYLELNPDYYYYLI